MASNTPKEDPVLQRLDTLIRIQARIAVSSIKDQKDKVLFLSGAGLGPKAVAELLAMTPNAVSSVLKRARKAGPDKDMRDQGEQG